MTKERLRQYLDLKEELKESEMVIAKIEKQGDQLVHDIVTGSSPHHPYQSRTFVVEGVASLNREYLDKLKVLYMDRAAHLISVRKEIEDWIDAIEDSKTRRVFRMRYIEGLGFHKIARIMHLSESTVRYWIHDRYLQSVDPREK